MTGYDSKLGSIPSSAFENDPPSKSSQQMTAVERLLLDRMRAKLKRPEKTVKKPDKPVK